MAALDSGTIEGTPAGPKLLVPTLIYIGMLVAIISSLGAPLIPTVAHVYGVTLSSAQWVLTAALMTGAVVTPIMGRLADGPRQRIVILTTLTLVALGCVISAVSTRFEVLILGRALQGFGLGLLPVNMAIARRHLPFTKAARAIAILSVSTAIGVGLGYPLTGLIAQVFNFRAAYWFGAIVVVSALVCAAVVLPPRSDVPPLRFDGIGAVMLGFAVIGVSVFLSEGGNWGWTSTRTIGVVAVCLLLVAGWVVHELRFDRPLVDLRHLRNRSVLTADITGFLMSVSMYLIIPIVVEFVQLPTSLGFGFGASIAVSGLVLVPLSITTFGASRFLVIYERRFGVRSMIPLGAVVSSSASLYFAFEHSSLWQAFVTVGIAGLGIGFTFAAMPGFIVRAVPHTETGSATGFYQVLRNVGLSVGSALGAAVLLGYTHHGHIYPEIDGFRAVLFVSAGLGFATALLSFVLPGHTVAAVPASDHDRAAVDELMEEEAELAGAGLMLSDDHDPLDEGTEGQ